MLGVLCRTSAAFFALLVDCTLQDDEPKRIEPPEVLGGDARLVDFRDRMRREIVRAGPELVVIVTSSYQASYEEISARATLEALIRLAAAEKRVPSEFLHQKTVRARLGIAPTGGFGPAAQRYCFVPLHVATWRGYAFEGLRGDRADRDPSLYSLHRHRTTRSQREERSHRVGRRGELLAEAVVTLPPRERNCGVVFVFSDSQSRHSARLRT